MNGRFSLANRDRFTALWSRCCPGPGAAPASAVFDEVDALYAQVHRRYHTARHIEACLSIFDIAADGMEQPDLVEMGLWFHDVIYDLCAEDNERRSADFCLERIGSGASEAFKRRLDQLIMGTVNHESPRGLDEAYMMDLDLASFGQSWEGFLRDSRAVRDEVPQLDDAAFRAKHRPFLERLLQRDPFYHTRFMMRLRGERARENISRYLAEYLNG